MTQHYLVTYHNSLKSEEWYGMDIIGCHPIEWLALMQEYPATYTLINVLEITKEQAIRYEGKFKGM